MKYTLHASGILLFGLLLLGLALRGFRDYLASESGMGRVWHAGACACAAWALLDLIAAVTR